jgi:transposase
VLPGHSARYSDGPTDAELAVDLLLRHPEHFKALKPQSAEMRALATMVEQRRRLVNEQGRITNRLRSGYCQVNANHALLEVISPYPATRNQ